MWSTEKEKKIQIANVNVRYEQAVTTCLAAGTAGTNSTLQATPFPAYSSCSPGLGWKVRSWVEECAHGGNQLHLT